MKIRIALAALLVAATAGPVTAQQNGGRARRASVERTGAAGRLRAQPATTLSLQASGNTNGNDATTVNDFRVLAGSDAPARIWASATGTDREMRSGDLVLDLKHVPAAGRNEVSFEGRLSGSADAWDARYGDAALADVRELSRNETSTRDASLQVDVTRTAGGFKIETGARAEQRLIGTDLTRQLQVSGPVDSGSNAFDYDTRIYAGYVQTSRTLGPVSL